MLAACQIDAFAHTHDTRVTDLRVSAMLKVGIECRIHLADAKRTRYRVRSAADNSTAAGWRLAACSRAVHSSRKHMEHCGKRVARHE